MKLYHGTDGRSARLITTGGLPAGSYGTTDFELAASYALGKPTPTVVVVEVEAQIPDEQAFDGEYVTLSEATILQVLHPKFNTIPHDWYELADDLSGRMYPELFDIQQWEA